MVVPRRIKKADNRKYVSIILNVVLSKQSKEIEFIILNIKCQRMSCSENTLG